MVSARWRLNPRRGDWLRTLRCLLTGHRWEMNKFETQQICYRCLTVEDLRRSCPGTCIAHIDCENDVPGCKYPEPHIHGFDCDKSCSVCGGRGIPVSDPENHPNHREWRGR